MSPLLAAFGLLAFIVGRVIPIQSEVPAPSLMIAKADDFRVLSKYLIENPAEKIAFSNAHWVQPRAIKFFHFTIPYSTERVGFTLSTDDKIPTRFPHRVSYYYFCFADLAYLPQKFWHVAPLVNKSDQFGGSREIQNVAWQIKRRSPIVMIRTAKMDNLKALYDGGSLTVISNFEISMKFLVAIEPRQFVISNNLNNQPRSIQGSQSCISGGLCGPQLSGHQIALLAINPCLKSNNAQCQEPDDISSIFRLLWSARWGIAALIAGIAIYEWPCGNAQNQNYKKRD